MADNQAVIDSLLDTIQMLSSLRTQYELDTVQLKAFGLKWLAKEVHCWYHDTEKWIRKLEKCLIVNYETDPIYQTDKTQAFDNVTNMLNRQYDDAYEVLEKLIDYRKEAWDVAANYTPDEFEHTIEAIAYQVYTIKRELNLVKKLGESGYIGARLEDE